MQKIKLSDITIKKIKSEELKKAVPELYELKNLIENNPWHNKESVFDHTLSVLDNLEKIIQNSNKETKQNLSRKIDKNSRKKILYLAVLLHDFGKKETITNLTNEVKICPDHERKGAKRIREILKRFDLSQKESKIITDIVRNHGVIHDIVGLKSKDFREDIIKENSLTHVVVGLENKDFKNEYNNFKKKFSYIYLELILLAFADTIGSYLKQTKPNEFYYRIDFYKKELKI